MQKRHQDRQCYFNELANTSRSFYIDYVKQFISLSSSTHILEIGCGEGGNLLPFAELDCKVTGIALQPAAYTRHNPSSPPPATKENSGRWISSTSLQFPVTSSS